MNEPSAVEATVVLTLIGPTVADHHVWDVTDGASTFRARMDDTDHIARVQRAEADFFPGDVVTVLLRTVGDGSDLVHSIVRVLEA